MQNLEQFRGNLLADVAARASVEKDFRHSAFVERIAEYLYDAEEFTAFEPCHFRGAGYRGRRLALDGFELDDADGSLRLLVVDLRGTEATETLVQTEARVWFDRLRAFFEDCLEGRLEGTIEESHPASGLASLLSSRRRSISRVRFYLASDAVLSTRVKDWPEGEVLGIPIEYHIWDITRFHRVVQSRTGRDDLVIDFGAIYPGGISCVPATVDADEYRAYLCVIPGEVLARIYDEYGSRLLESNVRSFLSLRGDVNKGIRRTILERPAMFFAFNNGIATTATQVDVVSNPDGLRLVSATDFQIVNGGQTTASLALARRRDKADLKRIFVQMKLAIIPVETAADVIPQISRSANSQNKVSEADFFSNHPFHRRIEEMSRRIWAPAVGGQQHETHWFYERARGQYSNELLRRTGTQQRTFEAQNPRNQRVTKTDLAKFENAWRQLPHVVCRGAEKNFRAFAEYVAGEWPSRDDRFNEQYFKDAMARAVLFRATERIVSAQNWYGGYRAQVVAHTIARLADLIEVEATDLRLDFRMIWQRQDISQALMAQIEVIAKLVFDVLLASPEEVRNISEWAKKETCWTRVKAVAIVLSPALRGELIDRTEASDRAADARKTQRIDAGISTQTAVLEFGAEYWSRILDWARVKGLLNDRDESLLRIASDMPRQLPSEKQSAALLQIRDRLDREGFGWLP